MRPRSTRVVLERWPIVCSLSNIGPIDLVKTEHMKIYNKKILIPKEQVASFALLRGFFGNSDDFPVRFVVTRTERDMSVVEVDYVKLEGCQGWPREKNKEHFFSKTRI
jgi:hypothetical protein